MFRLKVIAIRRLLEVKHLCQKSHVNFPSNSCTYGQYWCKSYETSQRTCINFLFACVLMELPSSFGRPRACEAILGPACPDTPKKPTPRHPLYEAKYTTRSFFSIVQNLFNGC